MQRNEKEGDTPNGSKNTNQLKQNNMKQITKQFETLSEAINFVRILKKYSDTVKMKSKGNIYTYSFE